MMTSSTHPCSIRSARDWHKHSTLRIHTDSQYEGTGRGNGRGSEGAVFHWCGCVHLPAMICIVGRLIIGRAFSFFLEEKEGWVKFIASRTRQQIWRHRKHVLDILLFCHTLPFPKCALHVVYHVSTGFPSLTPCSMPKSLASSHPVSSNLTSISPHRPRS